LYIAAVKAVPHDVDADVQVSFSLSLFHCYMRVIHFPGQHQPRTVCGTGNMYHPKSGWLGSRVVSVLDSGAEGPGFKSQPRRCRVTVLGKRQTVHTHRASVHQAAKLVAALLRVADCRPDGKYWQTTAGFMTHVTCRLTAKNRYQLQNPIS